MKIPLPRARPNKQGIVSGFKPADQYLLDQYDNPTVVPQTQIFSYTEPDEEESNTNPQTKICPSCENYNLSYVVSGIYICRSCGTRVEADNHEPRPTDKADMFMPSSHKGQYAQYDADDSSIPFVESIPIHYNDDQQTRDPDIELVRSSADGRIRHYRCKGLSAEALRMVNEQEGR